MQSYRDNVECVCGVAGSVHQLQTNLRRTGGRREDDALRIQWRRRICRPPTQRALYR
jgi:hypothetical protein